MVDENPSRLMQQTIRSFKSPALRLLCSRTCHSNLRTCLLPGLRKTSLISLAGLVLVLVWPALGQLPLGWTDADIGFPSVPGSATSSGGFWSVSGGGADIWGSSDQFNFAYQTTTNDVIVARVDSIQNTDGWAKAGVMFRDSSDPYSVFAGIVITSANGLSFQWRNSYAGQCGSAQIGGLFAPVWVKLVRPTTNSRRTTDPTVWRGHRLARRKRFR